MSRIGFGAEPLGGTDWGEVDIDAIHVAVRRALDLSVAVFDTADVYGLGLSETRLGEALGEARRHVRIVTKGGLRWSTTAGRARIARDASPAYLTRACEDSLVRLGVEQVSLYLLHWPDPQTPLAESIGALGELQRRGLIGGWGLSNHSLRDVAFAIEHGRPKAIEVPYSVLEADESERAIALAAGAGLEVLTYGALAQGMLTGKYIHGAAFGPDDRRHRLPHFQPGNPAWQVAEDVAVVASRVGRSPAQVALRWVLDDPRVTCAVVGAKSARQLEENLVAESDWNESIRVRQAISDRRKERLNERRADG